MKFIWIPVHDVCAHNGIKVICKTVHTIFSGEMGL